MESKTKKIIRFYCEVKEKKVILNPFSRVVDKIPEKKVDTGLLSLQTFAEYIF